MPFIIKFMVGFVSFLLVLAATFQALGIQPWDLDSREDDDEMDDSDQKHDSQ